MRLHSDLENSTPRGEPKNRQRKASLRQEFRQGCRVLISSLSWYLGQSRRSAPPNAPALGRTCSRAAAERPSQPRRGDNSRLLCDLDVKLNTRFNHISDLYRFFKVI